MDVSVSHLNNRLALRLPAQFPLGLVFVLGDIGKFLDDDNGRSPKEFDLVEKDYHVRCLLSERAALDVDLHVGNTIRAGGHLIFDPMRADYYLLVRDVEIVQSPGQESDTDTVASAEIESMMAEARKRAEAEKMAQGELPPWVKKLAPVGYSESQADANGETAVPESNGAETEREQLAQLSAAMDSDEDIELTSSLLEVAKKLNQARGIPVKEEGALGMQPPVMGAKYAYPTDVEDPEAYMPTGKITTDRILVLVIILAMALFLLMMLVLIGRNFLG